VLPLLSSTRVGVGTDGSSPVPVDAEIVQSWTRVWATASRAGRSAIPSIASAGTNRAMFLGLDEPSPREEVERWADEGVRVFLAAYGTGGRMAL
jgi:hypothetical protein